MTIVMLVIAIVSIICYVGATLFIVDRLEIAMVATMVGHEVDELVVDISKDPQTRMPRTASVNAYLLSRHEQSPVPGYLRRLKPNIYSNIVFGDKTYQVAILDINADRLFVEFDITAVSKYRTALLTLLISGSLLAAIVLVISGFWLSRKFLLPVSDLAEEVSKFSPDDLSVRIENRYQDYEVGIIARSIDQFLDRMNDFVEREQSFAASVSHELRTPVSVIATAIDLLELRGINDNQKAAVSRIKGSTDYMAKVIESLLFFARNTHDEVEKTLPEISLSEVSSNIVQQYKTLALEKYLSLKLEVESGIKIRIAESHLEIILGNLIQNAISNTSVGGIRVVLHEDGFSVADTGHGIEPGEIDLIVTRNYHSEDSMGCGLGLYLVKNICNIYGLKLTIESTVGKGSKFIITFPDSRPVSNGDRQSVA